MHASSSVSALPPTFGRQPVEAVRPRCSTRVRLLRGAQLMLGMLALASGSAMAATFCVGTGNELATAMETAAVNRQNDEIRIRTGTLTRSGLSGGVPRWDYDIGTSYDNIDYSIAISGGWTNCSTQVADPRQTVLDAQNQGIAVRFDLYGNNGAVSLSNLTITRGANNGASVTQLAANLGVKAPYSASTILLERLIVVAGSATSDAANAGGIKLAGFGTSGSMPTFTLRNSVIAYNAGVVVGGIDVNVSDSVVNITNNSIFSNTASSTGTCRCTGLDLGNDSFTYLSNNVVVDNLDGANLPSDVRNNLGSTNLRSNHIGNLYLEVPAVINLGTTTGNPGWTFVGIYPIPAAGSPLRDSGYNSPVGGVGAVDLAGRTRTVNGTVDRGAIEAAAAIPTDLIFADTFE